MKRQSKLDYVPTTMHFYLQQDSLKEQRRISKKMTQMAKEKLEIQESNMKEQKQVKVISELYMDKSMQFLARQKLLIRLIKFQQLEIKHSSNKSDRS